MSGADNTSYTTRSSAATTNVLTQTDSNLLLLALTGATAVTLPSGATVQPGREYTVYKDASAQTVTITPATGLVDGGASTTLATGATHVKTFVTDGTNWFTISAS
jgi:hypothetical protein